MIVNYRSEITFSEKAPTLENSEPVLRWNSCFKRTKIARHSKTETNRHRDRNSVYFVRLDVTPRPVVLVKKSGSNVYNDEALCWFLRNIIMTSLIRSVSPIFFFFLQVFPKVILPFPFHRSMAPPSATEEFKKENDNKNRRKDETSYNIKSLVYIHQIYYNIYIYLCRIQKYGGAYCYIFFIIFFSAAYSDHYSSKYIIIFRKKKKHNSFFFFIYTLWTFGLFFIFSSLISGSGF